MSDSLQTFRESLTLETVAAQVGIHPIHLSRVFRKRYRCTMAEYMNGLRVQFVCRAIERGWADLASIASDAGFADQSHMGRVFKSVHRPNAWQIPQLLSFPNGTHLNLPRMRGAPA